MNVNFKVDKVTGAELGLAVDVIAICECNGSPTFPSLSEKVNVIDTIRLDLGTLIWIGVHTRRYAIFRCDDDLRFFARQTILGKCF